MINTSQISNDCPLTFHQTQSTGYYQRSLAYQRHDLYLQYLNRAEKILCEKAGAGPRCFAAMPAIHQRFQRVNANLTKASSTKCSLAGLKLKGWSNKTHTDSIMYALSVVSTVGWGVFAPTNSTLRIITIFYAIIGLPLFGGMIAFTRDGVKALERQILNVKWIQEMVGSRVLLVMIAGLFLSFCMIGYGVLCWVLEKDEEGTIYEELHRQLKFDMTSDKQTWSFFTGIYYAFITMSCIGFGDEYIYDAHALLTYLKPLVQFLSIVIVIALLTRAFEGVEKKMHKVVDKSVSKLTTRT